MSSCQPLRPWNPVHGLGFPKEPSDIAEAQMIPMSDQNSSRVHDHTRCCPRRLSCWCLPCRGLDIGGKPFDGKSGRPWLCHAHRRQSAFRTVSLSDCQPGRFCCPIVGLSDKLTLRHLHQLLYQFWHPPVPRCKVWTTGETPSAIGLHSSGNHACLLLPGVCTLGEAAGTFSAPYSSLPRPPASSFRGATPGDSFALGAGGKFWQSGECPLPHPV